MVIKSDKLDKNSTGTYLGQNNQGGEETWNQIIGKLERVEVLWQREEKYYCRVAWELS